MLRIFSCRGRIRAVMREIPITANDAGRRLDRFLRKYLPGASLSEIYKIIRKDAKVDAKRRSESYILNEGEILTLYLSDEAFEKYDAVIGPVAPTAALKAGESLSDPLKMYLGDICTVLINIVGVPAISVPCGLTSEGLPVGMQIIGRHFDEQTLMGFAYAYERLSREGK